MRRATLRDPNILIPPEIRVADVCLDVDTAVLLAGLTRALVATALSEARRGRPPPVARARWVDAAVAAAARHGLAGAGVDPFTGRPADARTLLCRLLDHVHAAPSDRGDAGHITTLMHRLDRLGTGADRQRALFAAAESAPAFAEALARATLPGHEHPPTVQFMPGNDMCIAHGVRPYSWSRRPRCGEVGRPPLAVCSELAAVIPESLRHATGGKPPAMISAMR